MERGFEGRTEVDAQGGMGDAGEGLECGHAGDLVLELVHEQV